MDEGLAIHAERAAVLAFGSETGLVLEVVINAVDDVETAEYNIVRGICDATSLAVDVDVPLRLVTYEGLVNYEGVDR